MVGELRDLAAALDHAGHDYEVRCARCVRRACASQPLAALSLSSPHIPASLLHPLPPPQPLPAHNPRRAERPSTCWAARGTRMGTVLISLAWTAGILLAIITWRRLVPAPMPRIFDFILRTKFRGRTFSPEVAADRHGVAPGMRVLEVGPAGGYLTAAAAEKVKPGGQLVSLDLQLVFLKTLRARLGAATPLLVCGDASHLPFRQGCFDLAFVA